MSVMVPASTCGSSASCCALLKRWISSTNSTVRSPCWSRRVAASATASRRSLTPGQHRGERHEARVRLGRQQPRQRRLAGAGRPPQDQRRQLARLERAPQQLARPEEVRLADELVQRPRPHPLGQRLPAPILGRRAREQVHRRSLVSADRQVSKRTMPATCRPRRPSATLPARNWNCPRVDVRVAALRPALPFRSLLASACWPGCRSRAAPSRAEPEPAAAPRPIRSRRRRPRPKRRRPARTVRAR